MNRKFKSYVLNLSGILLVYAAISTLIASGAIVPGDKVKITIAPKGAGSENMSKVCMLKPAEGIDGVKKAKQALAAVTHIVLQDIDSINGRDSQDGIAFKFQLRLAVAPLDHPQLPFQNRGQEVAIATGRLQETGVNPLRFLLD